MLTAHEVEIAMATINIDDDTHQRLQLAAHVAGITVAEVIRKLAHEHQTADEARSAPDWQPIYSNYLGRETAAEFHPGSTAIRITSGQLKGQEFPTPSAAAIEVVKNANPERAEPHAKGWRFWKVTGTRRNIDSVFPRSGSR